MLTAGVHKSDLWLIFCVLGSKWRSRLFHVVWNYVYAKIWWSPDVLVFKSQTEFPRTSVDYGQLLRAKVLTTSFVCFIPTPKGVPNRIPDLIDSCLDMSCKIPINIYIYIYICICVHSGF